MKTKTLFSTFLLCVFFLNTQAQEEQKLKLKDVPPAVKESFQNLHPNASKLKWEMTDVNYEVEYKEDGMEKESLYNPAGQEIETEYEIDKDELPDAVLQQLNENYADYAIAEVDKVEKGADVLYEVELEGAAGPEFELLIDSHGHLLQEEKAKKEENEDH